MKIHLGKGRFVNASPNEDNCLGCHRIECDHLGDIFCLSVCELTKRGLDGSYYPTTDIEDLIVMEEEK